MEHKGTFLHSISLMKFVSADGSAFSGFYSVCRAFELHLCAVALFKHNAAIRTTSHQCTH